MKKNVKFAVLSHYSFDMPVVKLFEKYQKAKDYFKEMVEGEIEATKEFSEQYKIEGRSTEEYVKIIVPALGEDHISEFYFLEL